jgi:hypothetical protein
LVSYFADQRLVFCFYASWIFTAFYDVGVIITAIAAAPVLETVFILIHSRNSPEVEAAAATAIAAAAAVNVFLHQQLLGMQ